MNSYAIMSKPKKSLFSSALALAAAAFFAAPLHADPSDETARSNASGVSGANVSWLSGGIGDEARDEMRRSGAEYNVHLVFSTRDGAYLADIPFTVARPDGVEVYSGVSEGPLLYLKLRPGTYRISAEIDGATQSRRIVVGAGRTSLRLVFVSRSAARSS